MGESICMYSARNEDSTEEGNKVKVMLNLCFALGLGETVASIRTQVSMEGDSSEKCENCEACEACEN